MGRAAQARHANQSSKAWLDTAQSIPGTGHARPGAVACGAIQAAGPAGLGQTETPHQAFSCFLLVGLIYRSFIK